MHLSGETSLLVGGKELKLSDSNVQVKENIAKSKRDIMKDQSA